MACHPFSRQPSASPESSRSLSRVLHYSTLHYANAGAYAEPRLVASGAATAAAAAVAVGVPATMAGLDPRRVCELGFATASIPQCRLVCARAI